MFELFSFKFLNALNDVTLVFFKAKKVAFGRRGPMNSYVGHVQEFQNPINCSDISVNQKRFSFSFFFSSFFFSPTFPVLRGTHSFDSQQETVYVSASKYDHAKTLTLFPAFDLAAIPFKQCSQQQQPLVVQPTTTFRYDEGSFDAIRKGC